MTCAGQRDDPKITQPTDAVIRLVGAVLAGQDGEWTGSRRYTGPEMLAACRKAADNKEADVTKVASDTKLTIEAISA